MRLLILCAKAGAGKTTFLCAQVAAAARRGRSVGGIAAPAVFVDGRRAGYDLMDLQRGGRRPLARLVPPGDCSVTVGRYHLDPAAVAAGHAAIVAAVRAGLDVIAIDEVGPLEFRGLGWAPALQLALRDGTPGQELIVVVRPSLVDALAGRFPAAAWATGRRVSPPWPATLWP